MSFNGKKVVELAKSKNLKAVDFRKRVFPKRRGNFWWQEIIDAKNPSAETIEKIADVLECSIDEIFDRGHHSGHNVNGNNNNVESFNGGADSSEISHLRDIIARQDKELAEKNEQIKELISLAKR